MLHIRLCSSPLSIDLTFEQLQKLCCKTNLIQNTLNSLRAFPDILIFYNLLFGKAKQ